MDLGSLLGALAGEDPQQQNQSDTPAQGNDQVLGSLSGSAPSNPPATQGGGDLGSLLGALMGGEQGAQGGGDMMGMLGGLLGGAGASPNAGAMGGANTGMNSVLAPLADMLSQNLGISRDIALAALTIIAPMVLGKLQNADPSSGGLSFTHQEKQQMIHSLTEQTGMDHSQATDTLNRAVQMLGSE